MTKKRIAIQLFGYLRTYQDCYQSLLKKVVQANEKKGYDVDIFIHSWNSLNNANNRCGYVNDNLTKTFDQSKEQEILKIYGAKKVLIEEQKVIKNQKVKNLLSQREGRTVYLDSKNIYNMYYSIFKSGELRREYEKENNIKYDFVIQTRPDILFIKNFDIDEIIKYSKERSCVSKNLKNITYQKNDFPIFIAFWADFPGIVSVEPSAVWGNDLLLFSSAKVMDKVNSLSLSFDEEIKKPFWNIESFWINWIEKNKIEIQLIPYLMNREFIMKLFDNKNLFMQLNIFSRYVFYNILCFLTLFLVKSFKEKIIKYAQKL